MWGHHSREIVWNTSAARWAGKDEWVTRMKKAEEKEEQNDFTRTVLGYLKLPIEHLKKQLRKMRGKSRGSLRLRNVM